METYKICEEPAVRDEVRQHGGTQVMKVESRALGPDHCWASVRNGVHCTWEVDGEERFEVYPASQLVIVGRAI